MKIRDTKKIRTDRLQIHADGIPPAKLNRDIQAKLGDQLRQMYNNVVSQGVPDRFADLLAKIDQTSPDGSDDKSRQ